MDSWEDDAPSTVPHQSNHATKPTSTGGTSLNINAPAFSFNPSASSFTPYGQTSVKQQPHVAQPPAPDTAAVRADPPAEADHPMAEATSAPAQEDTSMEESDGGAIGVQKRPCKPVLLGHEKD